MQTRSISILAAVLALAACNGNPVAPSDSAEPSELSRLIGADGTGFFSDSTDTYGNTILTQEFAAGVSRNADGSLTSVASVTIQTVIPAGASDASSKSCINSSIVRTEALAGVTLDIKKTGGCNKDIVVNVEQKSTKRKATFSFSMVPGKTVIDSGLLK